MGGAECHSDVPLADIPAQVETDGQILSEDCLTVMVCSQMYWSVFPPMLVSLEGEVDLINYV